MVIFSVLSVPHYRSGTAEQLFFQGLTLWNHWTVAVPGILPKPLCFRNPREQQNRGTDRPFFRSQSIRFCPARPASGAHIVQRFPLALQFLLNGRRSHRLFLLLQEGNDLFLRLFSLDRAILLESTLSRRDVGTVPSYPLSDETHVLLSLREVFISRQPIPGGINRSQARLSWLPCTRQSIGRPLLLCTLQC